MQTVAFQVQLPRDAPHGAGRFLQLPQLVRRTRLVPARAYRGRHGEWAGRRWTGRGDAGRGDAGRGFTNALLLLLRRVHATTKLVSQHNA